MGDAFADRAQGSVGGFKKNFGERVTADADHVFTGFDAYKKVIDSVDVVILTTPPGFRPMQLKYAVEAGKHIFCEKPMAVDAPGVRSVMQTVEESKKKNIALVAGFCWRYSYPERAVFEQIHGGAVGDIVAIYSSYNTGGLWNHGRKPEWSDMEWQVRNWLYFTWLSGDHIVEQAVHTIDKMAWTMKDVMPIRAVGTGGRQVRNDPAYGHIYDHFAITYEWANGTRGFLYCRQQDKTQGDVSDHIMGTKAQANVLGGPSHTIFAKSEKIWQYAGKTNDMYQTEHDEMFASIRAGKPLNDGVRMTTSTMMAILGRMVAYTGQSITWEKALASQENLMPEKLEFGPLPTPPVAMPGQTKFI